MTYTYAELAVSPATYQEIAERLRDAGYDHVFIEDPDLGTAIDMHGIGLIQEQRMNNIGQQATVPDDRDPGQIAYEAYCEYSGNKSLVSGDELPSWDNLSTNIQEAWDAAAKAPIRAIIELVIEAAKEIIEDA